MHPVTHEEGSGSQSLSLGKRRPSPQLGQLGGFERGIATRKQRDRGMGMEGGSGDEASESLVR